MHDELLTAWTELQSRLEAIKPLRRLIRKTIVLEALDRVLGKIETYPADLL